MRLYLPYFVLLSLLSLGGCDQSAGVDEHSYACQITAECGPGYVCVQSDAELAYGRCVPEDSERDLSTETELDAEHDLEIDANGDFNPELADLDTDLPSDLPEISDIPELEELDTEDAVDLEADIETVDDTQDIEETIDFDQDLEEISDVDDADLADTPEFVSCELPWDECDGDALTECETNIGNDNFNCGACGVVCSTGFLCQNYQCKSNCWPLDSCDGSCVDLSSDPLNCGSCGTSCGVNGLCVDGACSCPAELTSCKVGCVDTQSNPNHCGSCFNPCGFGESCVAGVCDQQCAPGELFCLNKCVDPLSSRKFCGASDCVNGTTCTGTQECVAGACVEP